MPNDDGSLTVPEYCARLRYLKAQTGEMRRLAYQRSLEEDTRTVKHLEAALVALSAAEISFREEVESVPSAGR